MLLRARRVSGSVGFGTHVIAQGASTEYVIPAADLEHGNGNLRKIFLDRPLLPVIVIIGGRQPVEVGGRDGSSKLAISGQLAEIKHGIVGERDRKHSDKRICVLVNQALEGVQRQME